MIANQVSRRDSVMAAGSSSYIHWVRVALDGLVGPEDFEHAVARSMGQEELVEGERIGLILDFRLVEFVQLSVLHLLIAYTKTLIVQGHKIAFQLPQSKRVRDIWNRWGFAAALQSATGICLWDRVPEAQRKFATEPNESYTETEYPVGPGFSGGSIRSANFFALHTEFLRRGTVSPLLATQEEHYWTSEYIQDFLLGKVGLPAKAAHYLPGRVIFEAYMNAMRHPRATAVQVSAFATKNRNRKPTSFSVHFWDDGISMVNTLLNAILDDTEVQSRHSDEFHRTYLLKYSNDDDASKSFEKEISTRELKINKHAGPVEALAYTILPGVTSSPVGHNLAVSHDVAKEHEGYRRPGMGLFVLSDSVVDVLGGAVAFRTDRYFMNVRKPQTDERRSHPKTQIVIRIKERSKALPEFRGNLISVRLAIK